jgi:GNAT superfamily N-acetyltransferase
VELVLLTLVVRADARQQGLGAALLVHLIQLGRQRQQQQSAG